MFMQSTNYLNCIANVFFTYSKLVIFHSGGCTYPPGYCYWEEVHYRQGEWLYNVIMLITAKLKYLFAAFEILNPIASVIKFHISCPYLINLLYCTILLVEWSKAITWCHSARIPTTEGSRERCRNSWLVFSLRKRNWCSPSSSTHICD
jgi:hypothetical protein